MKPYLLVLTVALFLFAPGTSNGQTTGLKVLTPVEITIDDSTGAGNTVVNLRNESDEEKHVFLKVTVAGPKGSSAKFYFAEIEKPTERVEEYDAKLAKDEVKKVLLYAENVWDAGDIEADLNNETAVLTKIRMKRSPFNIKFDGATPDKADVAFINEQPSPIRLKNEDARPYPITWKLLFNGADLCSGNVTLPPSGVGLLNCSPTINRGFSRFKDLLKPETTDGHVLELYPSSSVQGLGNRPPVKTLSVSGSVSHYGLFAQQVWGYVIIVGVLILGGLTSLFLSQALPNRLQRVKLEEQIEELAKSTRDLSSHVESKLQVVLRLERSRIRGVLNSRRSWSPDFQGAVTMSTPDLARLKVRVGLAQQMDVVLRRLANMLPHGVPPQQVDAVEAEVRAAAVRIGKTAPTDADMEAAQSAITKASDLVERLNQPDPTFGHELAKQTTAIRGEIDTNFRATSDTFKRIVKEVPSPDETLQKISGTPPDIPADSYVEVDMAIEKMSLIRDYVLLHDARTGDAKDRLLEPEKRLIEFLQTDNFHDLRNARLLFREMKDDVYSNRIGQQLNNDAAVIEIDPRVAYHGAPTELCVHFLNPSLNSAAARDEWKCTWNFGDGLEETGWTVCHYFLIPPSLGRRIKRRLRLPYLYKFPIEARFEQRTEQTDSSPAAGPFVLNKELEVRSSAESGALRGRAWTEGLRLAAALLIAVFGLVAGARDQLTKLDILPGLVAVFLVGFGADTIKNLLTPKP